MTDGELQAELAHHDVGRVGEGEAGGEEAGPQEVAPGHQTDSSHQPRSQHLRAAVLQPSNVLQ